MLSCPRFLRGWIVPRVLRLVAVGWMGGLIFAAHGWAQEAPSPASGPYAQEPAPVERQAPDATTEQAPPQDKSAMQPEATYDPALFQRPIAKEQMAFLTQYAGMPSNALYREKQFRRLMKAFVPDCTFHYGSDKSLFDALDQVLEGSSEPVQVREGRYVLLSGHMGPFLGGRGFLWIDMQDGIGLGGFFFRPTNGEPTPAMNIFSKQVQKEMLLDMSELPPAFADDMAAWTQADGVPALTTRYFITGSNKKVLLEHDEDYCMPSSGAGYNDCEQMNEDATDTDLTAAEYLEQTHHVTNATAWMIHDPDEVAWIAVRDRTCGGVADPFGCHIRMTRERTRVILHAPPLRHPVPRAH